MHAPSHLAGRSRTKKPAVLSVGGTFSRDPAHAVRCVRQARWTGLPAIAAALGKIRKRAARVLGPPAASGSPLLLCSACFRLHSYTGTDLPAPLLVNCITQHLEESNKNDRIPGTVRQIWLRFGLKDGVDYHPMITGQEPHDMKDTPNSCRIAKEADTGLERGDVRFGERHLCQCLAANIARNYLPFHKQENHMGWCQ